MNTDFKKFEAFNLWRRGARESALYEWMRLRGPKIGKRYPAYRFWLCLAAASLIGMPICAMLIQSYANGIIRAYNPNLGQARKLYAMMGISLFVGVGLLFLPLFAGWISPKRHWLKLYESGFLAEIYATPMAERSILAPAAMLAVNRTVYYYLALLAGCFLQVMIIGELGARGDIQQAFWISFYLLIAIAPVFYPLVYLTEASIGSRRFGETAAEHFSSPEDSFCSR